MKHKVKGRAHFTHKTKKIKKQTEIFVTSSTIALVSVDSLSKSLSPASKLSINVNMAGVTCDFEANTASTVLANSSSSCWLLSVWFITGLWISPTLVLEEDFYNKLGKKIELRKIFTQISSENTDQIFLVIFPDKALKVEKIGSSFCPCPSLPSGKTGNRIEFRCRLNILDHYFWISIDAKTCLSFSNR